MRPGDGDVSTLRPWILEVSSKSCKRKSKRLNDHTNGKGWRSRSRSGVTAPTHACPRTGSQLPSPRSLPWWRRSPNRPRLSSRSSRLLAGKLSPMTLFPRYAAALPLQHDPPTSWSSSCKECVRVHFSFPAPYIRYLVIFLSPSCSSGDGNFPIPGLSWINGSLAMLARSGAKVRDRLPVVCTLILGSSSKSASALRQLPS